MRIYYFDQTTHDLIQYNTETRELVVIVPIQSVRVATGTDIQIGDFGKDNGQLNAPRQYKKIESKERRKRSKVTPEKIKEAKRLRDEGNTVAEICDQVGISSASFYKLMKNG